MYSFTKQIIDLACLTFIFDPENLYKEIEMDQISWPFFYQIHDYHMYINLVMYL